MYDFRSKYCLINTFRYHTQEVCGINFAPDEDLIASGGNDNKVLVWSVRKPSLPIMKGMHKGAVKALTWSKKQHKVLFSGGGAVDRYIKGWNTLSKELIYERQTSEQVCSLLSTKNNNLISGQGYPSTSIILWRAKGLKKITTLRGHSKRVLYLALSPDENVLISASADETLRFWNLNKRPD